MSKSIKDYSQINGWGIDADPHNDPTYPLKMHNETVVGRPTLQRKKVEILKSIERPHMPATFGTSAPPSGLSGIIRRMAFKYSESSYAHWLPLILADRVDMVEGMISDIAHAKIPFIFAKRRWNTARLKSANDKVQPAV